MILGIALLAAAASMNPIAESYVKLVLALGQHDPDYVDAYYGPPEWKAEADDEKLALPVIRRRAQGLIDQLRPLQIDEEMPRLRRQYLLKQLQSLVARAELLDGKRMRFDEESAALYDAVAPTYPESRFQKILDELSPLLPGEGSVAARYGQFSNGFLVPADKLDAVFRAAIDEARRRTLRHIQLPKNESFTVEYVQGQVWSAYNWYKGASRSVIQVNTDLPVTIDFVIRLACHEGYPGHHVYNALLEDRLVRERGWIEYSVYPLYSPQSLIAEGTAEFGVSVVFPEREQQEFAARVVFPLAGIDPSRADLYFRVKKLVGKLNYAGNEAARKYLDGVIPREEAIRILTTFGLMSPERAAQRVRFIEKNRSYVINYNLGEDLVREYLERRGATPADPAKLWKEFAALLSSPRLPSGLK
jgi:hypothetical protein